MIFWIVTEPLASSDVVLLEPTTLFSIIGIVSHTPFRILKHPVWEIPDLG